MQRLIPRLVAVALTALAAVALPAQSGEPAGPSGPAKPTKKVAPKVVAEPATPVTAEQWLVEFEPKQDDAKTTVPVILRRLSDQDGEKKIVIERAALSEASAELLPEVSLSGDGAMRHVIRLAPPGEGAEEVVIETIEECEACECTCKTAACREKGECTAKCKDKCDACKAAQKAVRVIAPKGTKPGAGAADVVIERDGEMRFVILDTDGKKREVTRSPSKAGQSQKIEKKIEVRTETGKRPVVVVDGEPVDINEWHGADGAKDMRIFKLDNDAHHEFHDFDAQLPFGEFPRFTGRMVEGAGDWRAALEQAREALQRLAPRIQAEMEHARGQLQQHQGELLELLEVARGQVAHGAREEAIKALDRMKKALEESRPRQRAPRAAGVERARRIERAEAPKREEHRDREESNESEERKEHGDRAEAPHTFRWFGGERLPTIRQFFNTDAAPKAAEAPRAPEPAKKPKAPKAPAAPRPPKLPGEMQAALDFTPLAPVGPGPGLRTRSNVVEGLRIQNVTNDDAVRAEIDALRTELKALRAEMKAAHEKASAETPPAPRGGRTQKSERL